MPLNIKKYDHFAIYLISLKKKSVCCPVFKDHFNYRHLITNKFTLNSLQIQNFKTGGLEHKSESIHTKNSHHNENLTR